MKRLCIVLLLGSMLLAAHPCWAYWMWTPKTGWSSPKTAVKRTPEEQFDYAKKFFDNKDYEYAKREFNKVIKKYPKAYEASEAQYYLAKIDDVLGNLYPAYLSYQKVIEKYPFSNRVEDIIKRQYEIGEIFLENKAKRPSLLEVEHPSLEIFEKVVSNSTYGPLAAKAQYKLGLVLKTLQRYYEAEDAFNRVITVYPESDWVEPAKYQLAECRSNVSRNPNYDQVSTEEARKKFQEFVEQYPDAVLTSEAEHNISALNEREAEGNYKTALFYEKQKDYAAARIYYNEVLNNAPESKWAIAATNRLAVLDKKVK